MEQTYTKETVYIAQCLVWANSKYQIEIFLMGLKHDCSCDVFKQSINDALSFANDQQRKWLCDAYFFVMHELLE